MLRTAEERPLGSLFGELASEIGALVQQEIALAKIELSENVSHVGKDVAYVAAGGAVLYAGLLALIATLIVGVGLAIGSLLAGAAIVTIVVLALGYFLLRQGLNNLKKHQLAPRQSIETLSQNVSWAKEQLR